MCRTVRRRHSSRSLHALIATILVAVVLPTGACPPPPVGPGNDVVDPAPLPSDPHELLRLAERWSRDGTPLGDKRNALAALDRAESLGADRFATDVLRARTVFRMVEENEGAAERAAWLQRGLDAAQAAIAARPDRAEGHYYLGVLLGLRAERATIGALDDVPRIHAAARAAVAADRTVDDCGPLRLMGMLLVAAPPWPQSIGDTEAGVEYLEMAAECSEFPLNRLLLAEALIEQGEFERARDLLRWVLDRPAAGRWGAVGNRYRPIARDLLERSRNPEGRRR